MNRPLLIYIIALLCFGCSDRSDSSIVEINDSTSLLEGRVTLYWLVSDTIVRPYDGVKVELLGTGLKCYTDSSGYWMLPGVTLGNYTLQFSAPGFDTAWLTNIHVAPPRGHSEVSVGLVESYKVNYSFDSIRRTGALITLWLSGQRPYDEFGQPVFAPLYLATFTLFANHTPTVSPSLGEHVLAISGIRANYYYDSSWQSLFELSALTHPTDYPEFDGFKLGDSIYAVLYVCRDSPRYDPQTRRYHWGGFRDRSQVIGFRL